ncbi:hypothetical protein GCM10008967_33900 [Bacillus carboniphilus]|uniref:YrzI family small protein n=1 Tax=Bacillus carboniphilus TaxID=86663 RepID=A0ABP3GD21_9BACI
MTFQFLFFTITVQKRKKTVEQYRREAQVQEIYDEMKYRYLEHFTRIG